MAASGFSSSAFARFLLLRESTSPQRAAGVTFERIRDSVVESDALREQAESCENRISSAQTVLANYLAQSGEVALDVFEQCVARATLAGDGVITDKIIKQAVETNFKLIRTARAIKEARNHQSSAAAELSRTRANEQRVLKRLDMHVEKFMVLTQELRTTSVLSRSMDVTRLTAPAVERVHAEMRRVHEKFDIEMREEQQERERMEQEETALNGSLYTVDADANTEVEIFTKGVMNAVKELAGRTANGTTVAAGTAMPSLPPPAQQQQQPWRASGPAFQDAMREREREQELVRAALSQVRTAVKQKVHATT